MGPDPAAILALISDLYGQIAALTVENNALREELTKATTGTPA